MNVIAVGRAACVGLPTLVDNDADAEEPSAEVQAMCNACPIKEACYELGRDMEFGIWGGTTASQRLGRKSVTVQRSGCPCCQSMMVVFEGRGTTCLDCNWSWHSM